MSEKHNPLRAAPMDVKVVLGRAQVSLETILNAEPGALFELDRTVGQPVDVLINDTPFGKGELAVAGAHMAVRITELFLSE